MKKMTQKLMFFFLLLLASLGYSQKVAVIGLNHVGVDGFTFVATQDLPSGEVIYFTENEYNDATNAFVDASEAVVIFTATSTILKGNVVFVNETATNTFTVSCTSGVCGTAVITGAGPFALGTGGESFYAYSDSDTNATNGLNTIYSVLFTGYSEGTNTITGGDIVVSQNPVFDYPTAIVIDGFPTTAPDRIEFAPTTLARTDVSKVILENPSNYVHAQTNQALSTIFFTNLNLFSATPIATVTASPSSVNENSGTGMVYTFTLNSAATSNVTINFSVTGSATFASDYTQTNAATFSASAGSVVIPTGSSSATVTLTATGDTVLEANETISLTVTTGTGYVAGSPGAASTTITNDDTLSITPVVAISGINHSTTADGFSFVALQNIAAGTVVYFTENVFDTSLLTFSGAEGVMQWTAPAGGVLRGQVFVATENGANSFVTTCSSGSCGSVTVVSGTFSLASTGEELYAYLDSDSNPNNGVNSVQAILYTGTSTTSGGIVPTSQDPATVYPGAVIVDGFPAVAPLRTEYNPTLRGVTVERANFQNPSNWIHAQSNITLSTVPFANIIISSGTANPFATVAVSPASVIENSGTAMVYTFSLSTPAVGNVTVNFAVSGSATFASDYTVSGSSSFNATTGSVVILSGNSSATVQVTPVGDTALEVQESVVLTIATGTGYDGGSPNAATGLINNDDTSDSDPLVAITGMSHVDPDGFSFVAAQDIPANSVIYFTDNSFNSATLLFSSGEAVVRWTSPGTVITKGNVIVVTESAPDTFSVTCSNGTCGSVTLLAGNLAIATAGETLYAYEDNDTNPSNGVTDIYAVLFTGTSSVSGGNIPSIEDPSTIFLSALVIDGFPAIAPARTEYDLTKRGVAVSSVNFEDISNWVNAQSPPALSTVPFANINILDSEAPNAICQNISVTPNVGTGSVTITAAAINNGSTDNVGIATYAIDVDTFTCTNIGSPVTVTLTVTDAAGNSDTCTATVTVLPNAVATFTQVAPICSGGSFTLPTTSTNGTSGTWAPAIDNTTTTTYTFTPNAGQCASSTTMTVVVNPNSTNSTDVTACETYTWANNGQTYTTSGTYTGTTTNCVTEELVLTITPITINSTSITACDTYTWANNGQTYTTSGTYTGTTTNCVTEELVLTITPSTSNTTTISACETYTWSTNGATYTTSGTYTSVTGCNTEILELTIDTTPTVDIAAQGLTCEGSTLTLTATALPILPQSNFVGVFDVANWVLSNTNADGNVNTAGAPSTISLTSGNNGSQTQGNTNFTITVPNTTTISFNWSYSTGDGQQFDYPRVIINGIPTLFTGYNNSSSGVDNSQSGTMTVNLSAGDTFAFNMFTTDNVFGAATVVISNFSALVGPQLLWTASNGGTIVGSSTQSSVNVTSSGTYTLTATSGTCSANDAIDVIFTPNTTPTFAQIDPICAGGTFTLPLVSNNGVAGTWSPANNTAATTTYTFTPDAGQCALTATMTIVVNPNVLPTFDTVTPVCAGQTLSALPTTSTNGITGIWSPALNNLATTIYTFTPDSGLCALTTTLTIEINQLPVVTCPGDITACENEVVNYTVTTNFTGSNITLSQNTSSIAVANAGIACNPGGDNTFYRVYDLPAMGYTSALTLDKIKFAVQQSAINQNITVNAYTLSGTLTNENLTLLGSTIVPITTATLTNYEAIMGGLTVPANSVLVVSYSNPSNIATSAVFNPGANAAGQTSPTYIKALDCGITQPVDLGAIGFPNVHVILDVELSGVNSGTLELTSGLPSGSVFPVGTTTVTYTATSNSGCVSTCSFDVVVNATAAPTGSASQILPVGSTLTNVLVSGTNIQWYDAANNGNLLPSSTVLVSGTTYYATQTINGCESQTFAVLVSISSGVANLVAAQCGVTISSLSVTINATYITYAQGYRFRITNLVTNAVQIVDRPVNSFALSSLTGITLGTPYQIEVAIKVNNVWETAYGAPCTVNTPVAVGTIGAQCGTTLTAMNQWIYATYVPNATGYRFRITNMTDNTVQISTQLLNKFNFTQLPNRSFATNYQIEVAVRNTDGTYFAYGTPCIVTTPNFPSSQLSGNFCGFNATSNGTMISAVAFSGATKYRFRLVNTTLGYDSFIERTLNTFNLAMFTGLTAGTTYQVTVSVQVYGIFGDYGTPCSVTTPGSASPLKPLDDSNVKAIFAAKAYPNPYDATFAIDLTTNSSEQVSISVYDMLGRHLETRAIAIDQTTIQDIGANYPSGVYTVILTQGNNHESMKVIKR